MLPEIACVSGLLQFWPIFVAGPNYSILKVGGDDFLRGRDSMKLLAKAITFGVAGIIAVAVGWYAKVALSTGSQSKFFAVKLVPQGNAPGELRAINNGKNCVNNWHEGCMLFEEDKIGLIKFYLPGSFNKVKDCDKAQSVITQVKLTTTGTDSKGDFTVFPLDDWIKNDAFPGVDVNDGIIYQETKDVARTQVWLVNMNSHPASEGHKQFWYEVTATDCASGETWVTDPRGENTGMN